MLRAPTDSPPQRLIVTLMADYRSVFQGPVASRLLVDLLQEFDIAVEASRSALARLTKRGVLDRVKSGRETSYDLSSEGKIYVEEDQRRILDFGLPRPWDGLWTMVLFSVGEEKRDRRHALKARLRALGFAPLYDGAWIAAFADPSAAQDALSSAAVEDADVFRATFVSLPARKGSLQEKWEVAALAEDYRAFISLFGPLAAHSRARALPPAEAFIVRTRLMDTWRSFPRREPDLPTEFLPREWPLAEARAVFTSCYAALRPAAEQRVADLLRR